MARVTLELSDFHPTSGTCVGQHRGLAVWHFPGLGLYGACLGERIFQSSSTREGLEAIVDGALRRLGALPPLGGAG